MNATSKKWSINDIKSAMRVKGSHWFDASALRFFRSRIGNDVFQGSGGIYFVSSEQFSDGTPRLYTVREFDPEAIAIRDGSNFQEFATLRAAKAAARSLAGEDSVSVEESFIAPTEFDDFVLVVQAEYPDVSAGVLKLLCQYAKQHQTACERECNDGGEHTDGWEKMIVELLDKWGQGLVAVFQSDPRGVTVKVKLPSGKTDDCGKEGICVSTDI